MTGRCSSSVVAIDRERLARVCGMLGSSYAGERAAAALQADKIVRSAGATWREVILPPALPASRPEAPQPARPLNDRDRVAYAREHPELLTDWERRFIDSLHDRGLRWGWTFTPRQRAVLLHIARKLGAE